MFKKKNLKIHENYKQKKTKHEDFSRPIEYAYF